MVIQTTTTLPSFSQLRQSLPIPSFLEEKVQEHRSHIHHILQGKDTRCLLIVGPCSIHNEKETLEYGEKLAKLQQAVKDTFFIVMRAYVEKPRTKLGWKGLLLEPHLNQSSGLVYGIQMCRQVMLQLSLMGLPLATELLDPLCYRYYEDLIAWGSIGARTSSSPIHRYLASGVDFPVGFKNPMDGNIDTAINAVIVANHSHTFASLSDDMTFCEVKTSGNPYAHIVLRGGIDESNYSSRHTNMAKNLLEEKDLLPRLIVDCSHDNCRTCYKEQVSVFDNVIEQIMNGHKEIAGLMLESHLLSGSQLAISSSPLSYGISITDPCIDFNTTQELVLKAHNKLKNTVCHASRNIPRVHCHSLNHVPTR